MADMKEETPRLPEGFKAFTEDTAGLTLTKFNK